MSVHIKKLIALTTQHFGTSPDRIERLSGDGSERIYHRIYLGGKSYIGAYGPNSSENEAFFSFSLSFQKISLPVPCTFAIDTSRQYYLLQDLGDTTLCKWFNQHSKAGNNELKMWYQKALEDLTRFQIVASEKIDYSQCYQTRTFDYSAMQADLRYFKESYIDLVLKGAPVPANLWQDFDKLTNYLAGAPADFFMYRDFQSKNIMLYRNSLYYVDFQSGRRGPLQYDVASLLFDANVNLDMKLRDQLVAYYLGILKRFQPKSEDFMAFFYDFALLRLLQALAAFGNLGLRKQKKGFLCCIPQARESALELFNQGLLANSYPAIKVMLQIPPQIDREPKE